MRPAVIRAAGSGAVGRPPPSARNPCVTVLQAEVAILGCNGRHKRYNILRLPQLTAWAIMGPCREQRERALAVAGTPESDSSKTRVN